MLKAVMYGAGNIGRGFIGALFARSGYAVTFIDIDEKLVNLINEKKSYPVRIIENKGYKDIEIKNVCALNGRDKDGVADAIATADIMATAVGVNVLQHITSNMAAGIKKRFKLTAKPLNIIICENLLAADKILAELITAELNQDDKQLFADRIGLVEASIGRMVPVQTEEMKSDDPLRICVEPYDYLPVDKAAFKGELPDISKMVPFEPFSYYIKRKLYIHNMGHAISAYLGDYSGKPYIYQSIDDPDVSNIVENAMLESALALHKIYSIPFPDIFNHIQDLLFRFTNAALGDTCRRVGSDPRRKLSPDDRLVGAARMCLEQAIPPVYIAIGIAGALFQLLRQEDLEQNQANACLLLAEVSGLDADNELLSLVLPFFDMFKAGQPVDKIRRAAGKIRAEMSTGVI